MHADDPARHARACLDVGDRNPGGVGGENAVVGDMRLDVAEHLDLEIEVLWHRLDDEVGARDAGAESAVDGNDVSAVIGYAQRREHRGRAGKRGTGLVPLAGVGVEGRDLHAGSRQGRRYARSHGAEADDRRVFMPDPARIAGSALRLLVGLAGHDTCRARRARPEAPATRPGKRARDR